MTDAPHDAMKAFSESHSDSFVQALLSADDEGCCMPSFLDTRYVNTPDWEIDAGLNWPVLTKAGEERRKNLEVEYVQRFASLKPMGPILPDVLDLEDPPQERLISSLRGQGFFVKPSTFYDGCSSKEGLHLELRCSSLVSLPKLELTRDVTGRRALCQSWEAWSPEFRVGWYGNTPREALAALCKRWREGAHGYAIERVARLDDMICVLERFT